MHRFIEAFQVIVGSPLFFTAFFVGTLAWMAVQYALAATHHRPWDDPATDFPTTVLIYTLVGLWIENAMKVTQKQQLQLQTEQMNRLEAMARDEIRRDALLHSMMQALEITVSRLYELERSVHGQTPYSTTSSGASAL